MQILNTPRNKNKSTYIFYLYALAFVVAALYHVNRYFFPSAHEPLLKHLLFLGIYTICVFGLVKRPKWFLYFFGALMLLQLYSHGSHLFSQWRTFHTINYIDLCVVVMMPVIFVSLLRNRHAAS